MCSAMLAGGVFLPHHALLQSPAALCTGSYVVAVETTQVCRLEAQDGQTTAEAALGHA
jgi:hypothetical protein